MAAVSVVKAIYDYKSTHETELDLVAEQTLFVLDAESDPEWWLVRTTFLEENESKSGLVPWNYVEPVSCVELMIYISF